MPESKFFNKVQNEIIREEKTKRDNEAYAQRKVEAEKLKRKQELPGILWNYCQNYIETQVKALGQTSRGIKDSSLLLSVCADFRVA